MRSLLGNIHFDSILPSVKATSRKQAFQFLAREAARFCDLPEDEIYKALEENAARGRSGIGDGVAIPHARFENLSKPCVIFAKLHTAIEYATQDGEPVDLICAIFAPEADGPVNLQRLSIITRAFRNETVRERLRDANSTDAVEIAFMETDSLMKAA